MYPMLDAAISVIKQAERIPDPSKKNERNEAKKCYMKEKLRNEKKNKHIIKEIISYHTTLQ